MPGLGWCSVVLVVVSKESRCGVSSETIPVCQWFSFKRHSFSRRLFYFLTFTISCAPPIGWNANFNFVQDLTDFIAEPNWFNILTKINNGKSSVFFGRTEGGLLYFPFVFLPVLITVKASENLMIISKKLLPHSLLFKSFRYPFNSTLQI